MTETPNDGVAVIILAAGAGTRMKSATPKMLHRVAGRTMLAHALHAAAGLRPADIITVVGHQRDKVIPAVSEEVPELKMAYGTTAVGIAHQEEQNGTGHAVACGLEELSPDFTGTVVVTTSDVPMINSETLRALVEEHSTKPRAAVTVLTATLDDPTGYGRIVRTPDGEVTRIVEQKDATDDELEITEINSGVYAFDAELLRTAVTQLDTDNAQGEFYLTDVIGIARDNDRSVRGHRLDDASIIAGVNDRVQLAAIGAEFNRRLCEAAMREGATIVDPASTFIDVDVRIGRDVIIEPGTQLRGRTVIGDNCIIGPDTTLTDMVVGEGASVIRTHGSESTIGPRATVGPFTFIRPGTSLGEAGKLGGFVEAKNATIGRGSKVPHLTYVGDATIGEESNIGASSVFVNYDGVNKHHTTIGSHVRTGSDTMFIAPVTVGDGAYSGAGTVIKDDVPPGALAVSGGHQRNIEGWVQRKRPGTPAADAAERAAAQLSVNNQEGEAE
ncbi:bifunctional UDP-N-acetylglucosamine diphosphorylase/glucosamine-1-phosphate N-acetyltransferase GlmU [Corynebacterium sp. CCM 9185]|uniref:Bifunctional protein GlmU n=1 Tax=Corynebacterium marambiense TaxID=2765364 RepID=A0ABS0VTD0_9CORY|nr:bifunctional UDP-N-acetylglucosamine diphosphorylase/glucosamine-1-phosphate N-acetyltransferase GlmU [Corynebacterium marambiense]MBI9000025.1 bifunctional UDP-N-acetylglucosamine diphosphorylase/glucosamine-1-phosphate N-acetyltransferase GlmU [Corynebacterium marambiense]MCK7663377.1 bifunctional UDP-N-acetylglucosamine diphosphorylase/glucosamine-1-phosphate N-acetyltransferase GlmU [Corynebacterium marambiense]